MRIFGFGIKKFETEPTAIQIIETWCVRWSSLHKDSINKGVQVINVQAFPTKTGAEAYANELKDARALLGDQGFEVEVYIQHTPTNV